VDGQESSESISMQNRNEDLSRLRALLTLRQDTDTRLGRGKNEEQILDRALTKDRKTFAIHPALPILDEAETPYETPDTEDFERVLGVLRDRKNQDFFDEVHAIEHWFQVLSSGERLAALHKFLDRLGTRSAYPLGYMLWNLRNSDDLSRLDLGTFQNLEKEKVRASLDVDFVDELWAIIQWFLVLSDAEQVVAFTVFLHHASPLQVAFLCCHRGSEIMGWMSRD
jgi:hypothetical protein